MIARAESCFENLMKSITNGEVTVAELELLKEHPENLSKLCEVYQINVKADPSPEYCLRRRLSELAAFYTLKDHVETFVNLTNVFNSGMFVAL